jgi:hypothetical protein
LTTSRAEGGVRRRVALPREALVAIEAALRAQPDPWGGGLSLPTHVLQLSDAEGRSFSATLNELELGGGGRTPPILVELLGADHATWEPIDLPATVASGGSSRAR